MKWSIYWKESDGIIVFRIIFTRNLIQIPFQSYKIRFISFDKEIFVDPWLVKRGCHFFSFEQFRKFYSFRDFWWSLKIPFYFDKFSFLVGIGSRLNVKSFITKKFQKGIIIRNSEFLLVASIKWCFSKEMFYVNIFL